LYFSSLLKKENDSLFSRDGKPQFLAGVKGGFCPGPAPGDIHGSAAQAGNLHKLRDMEQYE
jgi:hypothetical protein